MIEPKRKRLVARRAYHAEQSGDVLCLTLRGRVTPWRLRAITRELVSLMRQHDTGAVLVNATTLDLAVTPDHVAALWFFPWEDCAALPSWHAARFCGVVLDDRDARAVWVLRQAGNLIASKDPVSLLELFASNEFKDASHWADRHATFARQVRAAMETRAAPPAPQAPRSRKRRP